MKKYYNGEFVEENALCDHCGITHIWDAETCAVYENKFICEDCFQKWYGFCNECHNLFKYEDMNKDIICKDCSVE